MNGKDLLDAFQNIDEDLIKDARNYHKEEIELFEMRRSRSHRNLITFAVTMAAVACLILMVSQMVTIDDTNNNTDNDTIPLTNINDTEHNNIAADKSKYPEATLELERQIKENARKTVVTPISDNSNTYVHTLEYLLKVAYEPELDSIEYIDIPMGEPLEYKGVVFTIKDYSILSGSRFFKKYGSKKDKEIQNTDPEYYGDIEKNGTYAVVHWNIKKLMTDPVTTENEMIFTDEKWAGLFDQAATDMVNDYMQTEEKSIEEMQVGDQLEDGIFVLSFCKTSSTKEYYILLPLLTYDDIYSSYNRESSSGILKQNKFYRIKLGK